MNILNFEHIHKIYGDKVIFDDVSFGVQEGDKIGIIGINGTGKSTLLKIAAGKEAADAGQVIRQNGKKMIYLPQDPEFPADATVSSFALENAGENAWKIQRILNQLGIQDFDMKISSLSGGQKRRVAMARAFSREADILLLDEPTNHMDEEMLDWLEKYLKAFTGTILMVTHDRYFLDQVSNKILEISHGALYSYEANYSGFLELKAQREEMELASQRKRQSLLRMELEWAKRGCRARSTKQKARLQRLEELKKASGPVADSTVELDSVNARMGKKTLELHHISKSYGEKKILEDFSYIFLKNQTVGFVGPNGCGKSTLMKILAGLLEPDQGSVEMGQTIKIGYFAQEGQEMEESQRVIDYVRDIAEYINTSEGRISASQMLERFLFTPDMQYSPIGKLSGGEKRRLYLLGILSRPINVLILDEIGNALDIPTMTILEDFLNTFGGIVITVSHDRYFLDNVADRIFEFDGYGNLQQYEGGYTDYREAKKKNEQETEKKKTVKKDPQDKNTQGKVWKQNCPVKLKFTYKEQKEYEVIDSQIEDLEGKIAKLEEEMMENATNSGKLYQLTAEKEQAEQELEEKMERWVYLNDLAERIEEQKKNK